MRADIAPTSSSAAVPSSSSASASTPASTSSTAAASPQDVTPSTEPMLSIHPLNFGEGGLSLRRLRPDHLARPESRCLAYNPSLGGLFCRYCVLFIAEAEAQRHHFSSQRILLVQEPLKKFSLMFGKNVNVTSHVEGEGVPQIQLRKS
ncbi:hypothetical protein Aduo_012595 [Ancylostoma duodenale]